MRLFIRWLIASAALIVAAWLVPGIEIVGQNGWFAVLIMAGILGLANAFIRPLLTILSCPLVLLTLGLFTLVINAVTFSFASWVAVSVFNVGFVVNGFWPAFFGSLIVSVVSFLLSVFLPDEREQRPAAYR